MSRGNLIARALLGAVASFVAAWWLIGDQSEAFGDSYVWRAPSVPDAAVTVAGVIGLVIVVAIIIERVVAVRRDPLARHENVAILASVGVGLVLAAMGRVLSAATTGANLGAGFAVFVGFPLILGLVVVGVDACRKVGTDNA